MDSKKTKFIITLAMALGLVAMLTVLVVGRLAGPKRRPDSPGSEPRYTLLIASPPGSYEVTTSLDMDMKIRFDGRTQKANSSVRSVDDRNVFEPDESGQSLVSVQHMRLLVKAESGAKSLLHDSNRPETMDGPFKEFMNVKVIRTVDDGRFVDIESLTDEPVDEDVRKMAEAMEPAGSGLTIEEFADILPDHPVGVGAIWHPTVVIDNDPVGRHEVELECELMTIQNRASGRIAIIEYKGSIEGDVNQAREDGSTFRSADLTLAGQVRVEIETGLVLSHAGLMGGKMDVVAGEEDVLIGLEVKWQQTQKRK